MKTNNQEPSTFLGFDYGTQSIGVAVGQTITNTAQVLTALQARKGIPNWNEVALLIQKWNPQALIVGLPLNMNGTEQSLTQKVKEFIENLELRFHLPVYTEDERLTTIEARAELFKKGGFHSLKKQKIDALSAQLILEAWMKKREETISKE